MNPLSDKRRQFPKDEAGRHMSKGDTAFRRGRMSEAYKHYSAAVLSLQLEWMWHRDEAPLAMRLARAYISQCYPAHRKALARGTQKRKLWDALARDHEKQGCDMYMLAAGMPHRMTDDELLQTLCVLHNFAGRLSDTFDSFDADEAQRYADGAYTALEAQQPGETMPKSLDFGFMLIRARIALSRGQYEDALKLVQPVIDHEQRRLQRARKQHKKLPPPAWLRIPTDLRDKIEAAITK